MDAAEGRDGAHRGDGPDGGVGELPAAEGESRRRRAAAAVWLCAVVGAGVLGVWSYGHAGPAGRYPRPKPLDDADVRRELSRAEREAAPGKPPATPPPAPSPGSASASEWVRLGPGLATVAARCGTDGRVRLLSWSPAAGYGTDGVARGPAPVATIRWEPLPERRGSRGSRRSGGSGGSGDGGCTVAMRCVHGVPRPAASPDGGRGP